MKHTYFEVFNFKGIEHIKLDLNSHPTSNIYTLVGLNESGKTTILEAINFFNYKEENLDPLNLQGYSVKDVHELIPISKRSNFNDKIIIRVGYRLDDTDKEKLLKFLNRLGFIPSKNIVDKFHIEQSYEFKDSRLILNQPQTIWYGFRPSGKYIRSKKEVLLRTEDWHKFHPFAKSLIPSVLYFPIFFLNSLIKST